MTPEPLPPNLPTLPMKELIGSTYNTSDLISRLYLEAEYLFRNRKPFRVEGIPTPPLSEVSHDEKYFAVRQFLSETEDRNSSERHLILANEYPSHRNQYANGFVHRRVELYREAGLEVDVLAFGKRVRKEVYSYRGIPVLSGYYDELLGLLATRKYKSINVHFLNSEMWNGLLLNIPKECRVNLFIHGYEVRNWSRLPYEIAARENIDAQIERSLRTRDIWSTLVDENSPISNFVFVSEWWKQAVGEDLRLVFPEERSHVIHNVIDTALFSYQPKSPDQRHNLLWVRNARAWNYGADLAAELLGRLKQSFYWNQLKVTLVGDGKYFHYFDQFKDDSNVTIINGYISQQQIADLHKSHGIFLVPSRFDTQGVSRDEAMSSGLVPVTCPVAAVTEFVDESCAILGTEDNLDAWAAELEEVILDPA